MTKETASEPRRTAPFSCGYCGRLYYLPRPRTCCSRGREFDIKMIAEQQRYAHVNDTDRTSKQMMKCAECGGTQPADRDTCIFCDKPLNGPLEFRRHAEEPPYYVQTFWSPDRRYLVSAHATLDGIVTLQDDNGREWVAASPQQNMGGIKRSADETSCELPLVRNALGNLVNAVARFAFPDDDIKFALREARAVLGGPYITPQEPARELTLHDFGYAPGNYTFKCHDCGQDAVGDKRALRCETCAAQALRENRRGAEKASGDQHVCGDGIVLSGTRAQCPSCREDDPGIQRDFTMCECGHVAVKHVIGQQSCMETNCSCTQMRPLNGEALP